MLKYVAANPKDGLGTYRFRVIVYKINERL